MKARATGLGDDMLLVRDLIQQRDELKAEYDSLKETAEELAEELENLSVEEHVDIDEESDALSLQLKAASYAVKSWEYDNLDDLKDLNDAIQACEDYGGDTLILDEYFIEYAKEYAMDIGAIDDDMHWPCNCIDWEAAAEELRSNFTVVEIGGCTYYMR